MDTRFVPAQDKIPTAWYDALSDLPEPLPPPLHPGTTQPPQWGCAIRGVIDEARAATEAGDERVILFNESGHGLCDVHVYDDVNHDRLIDA